MLNLFKTPEGKEFIFIIQENAKVDKNGFYIIDADFKEANKHQSENWDYLTHDLEYRGLSAADSFYDRVDYMTKKLISHGDYYLQFSYIDRMEQALLTHFGAETLRNSVDPCMNDIPIRRWDYFDSKRFLKPTYKYAVAATYRDRDELWRKKTLLWSPSCNVSIAKQVAYGLREKLKLSPQA